LQNIYVLDTSAIFTYSESENGADKVESILSDCKKGKCVVYISFITLMEIYYITWQKKSETDAKEFVILVKSLPVHIVESNEQLILSAGRIKANHRLSLADAIIAATALEKKAILVHKDPELEEVSSYVKTVNLPYKNKKS
jgi:predicted nucleic acid-binding protein